MLNLHLQISCRSNLLKKYAKEDLPRSIRYSDHLTGEIGFIVKEKLSKYGEKKIKLILSEKSV